jgi:hypothetical protein
MSIIWSNVGEQIVRLDTGVCKLSLAHLAACTTPSRMLQLIHEDFHKKALQNVVMP